MLTNASSWNKEFSTEIGTNLPKLLPN